VSTGISDLDAITYGGFIPGKSYLVRGGPGTGKTILGMHFLSSGIAEGEKALFITLGEPKSQLCANAKSFGFDVSEIEFLDLGPESTFFTEMKTYDFFSSAEVERDPTTKKIIETINTVQPSRVFIDSMTHFKYLSNDSFQFRKQVLSFLRFLLESGATVLSTSEASSEAPDEDLQFLVDGIINLSFERKKRIIEVSKFRGSDFVSGLHAMRITSEGLKIYRTLVPEDHHREFKLESISSGLPEFDKLTHGGLERGTISLITGPSGTGKTTLGVQIMKEAAERGERSVVYTFEESLDTILNRSESVNIPVNEMLEQGTLSVVKVEPLEYTPSEFADMVREEVEKMDTKIVMLDSLSGYKVSLQGEDLTAHVHALCKYLSNMGITVLLINETQYLTGDFRATDVGISYLSDNIIFLRYLEIYGQMRKAIGVLKKRLSDFENTLRELEITSQGIKIGGPLTNLRGILSGIPTWKDEESSE